MNIEKLEEMKAKLSFSYHRRLVQMYLEEISKVFVWFEKHYPKRTLEWKSGMGTHFWVLDDEILHWDASYFTGDGYTDVEPDRYIKKLLPLWNFYLSICDSTNIDCGWIDIGDVDISITKKRWMS